MAPIGDPMATARSYHQAWWRGEFDTAADYVADDLQVEVPINSYAGKAPFLEAAMRTRQMATRVEMLAEMGDRTDAVLIYDLDLPVGPLRIAELFTVRDGQISRVRHIHDTAALRAAGMGKGE